MYFPLSFSLRLSTSHPLDAGALRRYVPTYISMPLNLYRRGDSSPALLGAIRLTQINRANSHYISSALLGMHWAEDEVADVRAPSYI